MWDWLGEPLALDTANTVRRHGWVYRDLWRSGTDVVTWARHEAGRLPCPSAAEAEERLTQLRAVRDDVFAVLAATADGQAYPVDAADRLNELAREHPQVRLLGERPGEARPLPVPSPHVKAGRQPVDELLAVVVHSTIAFTESAEAARLRLCDAPGCGQFFLYDRTNQVWCGSACGTRARVARHERHRRDRSRRARPAENG